MKSFPILGKCLTLASSLLLLGHSHLAAAQDKITWTMVSPLTPAIAYMPLYQQLADNITERSQGRLTVNFLSFGQHPFKGPDILTAVRDGVVQIGNSADVYVSSLEPAVAFMGLPFLFDNLEQAKTTFNALKEPYYQPIFADKYQSELLTSFVISGSAIHAKKPLDNSDALKGQKIRVFGKESGDMIRLLGGEPATVAFGELYTALQRGTIDGALTGMDGANAARVYEVVDNNTWWNWSYPVEFTFVNRQALAALPEDLQTIVREEAASINAELQANRDLGTMRLLIKAIEQDGITVTGLSAANLADFRTRTQPILDEWQGKTGALGEQAFAIYHQLHDSAAQ
ncbi:TRAP transporter substrate-binding protein DctP [Zobellella aerophila]|uniref:TRAP transporter substrate-binding protein n=1 Tax=Zobellella aerophila TaxID=870480 RepID=A0ABP6VFT6_9GAMM